MAATGGSKRATQVALLDEPWMLDVVTDLGVACGATLVGAATGCG